jgi:hypothetical protein
MAWPWDVIGLRPDATPREVEDAWSAWRATARESDDPEGFRRKAEAFEAAIQRAAERDPSHLPAGAYPDPWDRPADEPTDDTGEVPPALPEDTRSEDEKLAQQILTLTRAAEDFDELALAVQRFGAWHDRGTRTGAERLLRDAIVGGESLRSIEIVRISRLFDWQPESPPMQPLDEHRLWKARVHEAWQEYAPPDPAYTEGIGRTFLLVAGIAGALLSLLILPRVLAGGIGILIPIAFAALCAWLLIKWKR